MESLRTEAARRGVSVYRVRVERAAARGISRAQAAGHPRKGEPLLRQLTAALRITAPPPQPTVQLAGFTVAYDPAVGPIQVGHDGAGWYIKGTDGVRQATTHHHLFYDVWPEMLYEGVDFEFNYE